jgi:hypothetical protein
MKKRSLILKTLAIANALLVTGAFVGCPARKDPSLLTIAPPPIVTIAPYGGIPQNLVPADQSPQPGGQGSRNDQSGR